MMASRDLPLQQSLLVPLGWGLHTQLVPWGHRVWLEENRVGLGAGPALESPACIAVTLSHLWPPVKSGHPMCAGRLGLGQGRGPRGGAVGAGLSACA